MLPLCSPLGGCSTHSHAAAHRDEGWFCSTPSWSILTLAGIASHHAGMLLAPLMLALRGFFLHGAGQEPAGL